jgi:tetratricopeptide (TPR) repeat protein
VTSLEDIYLFRHAAFRDVAYSLQLPSDRARLHAAAFEITEHAWAGEAALVAAELAEHARLAQDGAEPAEAARLAAAELRYLGMALKRFRERAQWDSLLQAATRMLECPGCEGGTLIEAQYERASALESMGRRPDALDAYLQLADEARAQGHHKGEVNGCCGAALASVYLGRHEQATSLVDRAEKAARANGAPALLAKALMDRAMLASARGEFAENERYLREAMAVYPPGSTDPFLWIIRGNLANLYSHNGRRSEAIATYLELLRVLKNGDDGRMIGVALGNLGRQYMLAGELGQAETCLLEAIDSASEHGNLRSAAFALANLAEVDLRRGNLDRAATSIARASESAREFGLPIYHAAYRCTEALLQLLIGREQEAQQAVEDARAEFLSVGGEAFVAEYCGVVRLRIAASQAVSMAVPGRVTSRLRTDPPAPIWLPVMRAIAAEIKESCMSRGSNAGAQLEAAHKAAAALVAEVEAAVNEQRPALVFRGHLPGEMRPELRRALVARMSAGEAASLKKLHPALWQALGE